MREKVQKMKKVNPIGFIFKQREKAVFEEIQEFRRRYGRPWSRKTCRPYKSKTRVEPIPEEYNEWSPGPSYLDRVCVLNATGVYCDYDACTDIIAVVDIDRIIRKLRLQ